MDFRALAAFFLLLLASGCVAADSTGADGDFRDDDGTTGDADEEPGTNDDSGSSSYSTQKLGDAQGSTVAPARFPFDVTAPEGGARDVRYTMTIESVAATPLTAHLEGPGCTAPSGINFSLIGDMTFGGECSSLGAGVTRFEVVLDGPALSFSAEVTGMVQTS